MAATLTVFTPTYNRAHTLPRLYRSLCRQTNKNFLWLVVDDGSTDNTRLLIDGYIKEGVIPIDYIYKENGGLYTGYNVAYEHIDTELNVCVDSDDFMPDNAIALIVDTWRVRGSSMYAGIIGLDFYSDREDPIAGYFPDGMSECYLLDLYIHKIHHGDSKQVMRTELMKRVAPQIGFPEEKNFNPIYMLLQVCDDYPLLVLNRNLCYVEYQKEDSMSANIFRQYIDSPRSFAKTRRLEMSLKRSTFRNNVRSAIHYVAECMIAGDSDWLKKSPRKLMTLAVAPVSCLLLIYIKLKLNGLKDERTD
jgi:glycosyltransferase involved in cell wall biosynthesis